jgi:hypothetical protein
MAYLFRGQGIFIHLVRNIYSQDITLFIYRVFVCIFIHMLRYNQSQGMAYSFTVYGLFIHSVWPIHSQGLAYSFTVFGLFIHRVWPIHSQGMAYAISLVRHIQSQGMAYSSMRHTRYVGKKWKIYSKIRARLFRDQVKHTVIHTRPFILMR